MLSRFDNKRAVIRALFRRIFNVEYINSSSKIHSMIDEIDIIVRGLNAAGEKVEDTFSRFFTYHVSSRLDKETSCD